MTSTQQACQWVPHGAAAPAPGVASQGRGAAAPGPGDQPHFGQAPLAAHLPGGGVGAGPPRTQWVEWGDGPRNGRTAGRGICRWGPLKGENRGSGKAAVSDAAGRMRW